MAPDLLPVVQMKSFEGFFNSLMTGETGLVVVNGFGAKFRQCKIGLSLMKLISRAIHPCSDGVNAWFGPVLAVEQLSVASKRRQSGKVETHSDLVRGREESGGGWRQREGLTSPACPAAKVGEGNQATPKEFHRLTSQ